MRRQLHRAYGYLPAGGGLRMCGLMSDLAIREQRLTAVLVCERLLAFGMEAELCYAGETIWLQVGPQVTTCIQWPRWWDAGLATREDQAIEVAGRLWTEGYNRERTA